MSVIAVIQARLGSQRLPRKALRPIGGRPMILHVIERVHAAAAKLPVICAIPDVDEELGAICRAAGALVVYGSAGDVLSRFSAVLNHLPEATAVVRVTGDCPLLPPEAIDHVLERFHAEQADYAWNDTLTTGWPDGADVEMMTAATLRRCAAEAKTPYDREHVTSYLRQLVGLRCVTVPYHGPTIGLKLSVDTEEDLSRVQAIMAHVAPAALCLPDTLRAARHAGVVT